MMRFVKALPILLFIGLIALIVSCEEDKATNPQEQIPTIPPQSTFMIDFSEFPDTLSTGGGDQISLTRRNWGWAALNVSVWNSKLTLALIAPAAAFREAFNHQPVKQSDGSWLWQYIVIAEKDTFTAKLYGKVIAARVEWRMLLSVGSIIDFEWFTGFSNTNATEGNWTLNSNLDPPAPFLNIEWHRNTQEGTADVKYTNIVPNIPEYGSYIHYGKTNDVLLNRYYQIFDAEESRLIDIKWNYELHFGRVKDPVYFEDENWYCWDENLEDIFCPE